MPKINFNVPLTDVTGEIVNQPVIDKTRTLIAPNGQPYHPNKLDEDNKPMMQPVLIKDMVARVLNSPLKDDDKLERDAKVNRGRLARKVVSNSTANYTIDQVKIIQDLCATISSIEFLTQLDDIINGEPKASEEVAA